MAKHTPGPWTVDPSEEEWGIFKIHADFSRWKNYEEAEAANARLIAVAPEMYELLALARPLVENYIQGDFGLALAGRIESLLAKIDGDDHEY